MRLIDADALAKFIDYGHLNNPDEKLYSENDFREMIDMMPTIDAIPIEWIMRYAFDGKRKHPISITEMIADWRKEHAAEQMLSLRHSHHW